MEATSKRIIVVILIAVIAIGSGVWTIFFYIPPKVPEYIPPGIPTGVDPDQILRIGIPGDTGEITGDGTYEGAYLAAKEINTAGGITVGVDTYYFGIIREDTDECNPNLVTSRGIAAAERLVYDDDIDYAIGGFRTEAVLAYQEVFMDNEILFLSVGVIDDIFTQKVKNYYDRYKYYFRVMPTNSTSVCGEIFAFISYMINFFNAMYGVGTISEVGIIAEDLNWTDPIVDFLNNSIPYTGATIPEDCLIRIPYSYSLADYQPTIQTMIDNGVDLLIPVISSQYGIMMMQQYTELEPDFVVVGINIQSQLDFFWEQSNEACAYETVMQGVYNVNKTPTTQAFWAAFRTEFAHDPLYTAIGAYDAIYYLSTAIQTVQTLETTEIIAHWETWTRDNPRVGAAGNYAWWPESHELVSGYPYMYGLWTQWQPDGTKTVVPGFGLYDDSLTTGDYTVPPWVHTAWSA